MSNAPEWSAKDKAAEMASEAGGGLGLDAMRCNLDPNYSGPYWNDFAAAWNWIKRKVGKKK